MRKYQSIKKKMEIVSQGKRKYQIKKALQVHI